MRGGCKEFSLRRFVLNGPEVLKIVFSCRQWIDIHTKKKPKSKSHSETEVSSHLRKNVRNFRISRKFLIFVTINPTSNFENLAQTGQDHGKFVYFFLDVS